MRRNNLRSSDDHHPTSVSHSTTLDSLAVDRRGHSLAGARWMAVLRMATGFIFLWAFLDKLFGLGYSTQSSERLDPRWLPDQGIPVPRRRGTLPVPVPLDRRDLVGRPLFMLGLGGVGIAVMLGIGMRIAAGPGRS